VKLSLASDLRWLISEGYVIEFNDGTLELPRAKAPAPAQAPAAQGEEVATPLAADPSGAGRAGNVQDLSPVSVDEVGGMAVEQTVEPAPEPAPVEAAVKPAQATAPEEPASEEPDEAVPSPS
jgi:hypothetical protein